MVKLIALYKKPENPAEFDRLYFESHLPLARKMPGLQKADVSKITGAPQGDCEYYMVAQLYFDSMEALTAAMSSEEGRAAARNLMSFARGLVSMMFAEEVAPVSVAG